EGITGLRQEIETFNMIALVTAPRWLTSAEKREGKAYTSVVLATQSLAEAENIVKKGALVFGRRLKAERYIISKPADQCSNCQQFGHHHLRCSQDAKCQICAGNYNTHLHRCAQCNQTDKTYGHSNFKCANCGKPHKANDQSCEVIK